MASSVVILYPYILFFLSLVEEQKNRVKIVALTGSFDLARNKCGLSHQKLLYYKHSTQWQNSEILTKSIQQNRNIKLSIFWHNTIVVCIISFSSLLGTCCGGKLINPANKVLHKMTALY